MKAFDKLREVSAKLREAWDEIGALIVAVSLISAFVVAIAFVVDCLQEVQPPKPPRAYTVETFNPDLTIRIQCSGDCDLAAMIAEAREVAGK